MTAGRSAGPSIEIVPERPRFDERISIELDGFPPDESVTVTAHQRLADGLWASEATFRTDDQGHADVADSTPVSGTYEDADPMGLFWSMEREATVSFPRQYVEDRTVVSTELTASVDGKTVASRIVERKLIADGVTHETIREDGLVGELYAPEDATPAPPVVVLGGSKGGLPPRLPVTLLASEGYTVLALAYFGYEDLPPVLKHVPLEYFEGAFEWLRNRDAARRGPIGVVGWSRGAELALLLGARFQSVRTVVAYAPSGVVFESSSGEHTSAWSVDGEPVPYVPIKFWVRPHAIWRRLRGQRIDLTPAYERSYEQASEETLEAATIPVEEIGGPVLLLSGLDDGLWPSSRFGDDIVERLDAHDYSHRYDHVAYEDAGHGLSVPYQVTTERQIGPRYLFDHPFEFGGTPEGYAAADEDAWSRTLAFLEEGLRDDVHPQEGIQDTAD